MADDHGDKPMEADTNTLKPPQMGLKLVHLDLKGAPPKISYLTQIFPLFSHLGANGVLLEYEDMFPYEGKLQVLRSPNAYSPSDIREILNLARMHNFEVIPLVQTFGHMEFVLKHKTFSHLREMKSFPNSLNPHKKESMELVKSMIDQIMAIHTDLKWMHIGSDEVYYLGEGEESKKLFEQSQTNVDSLFLSHVKAVASYIITSHPDVKPILWDDMLRNISEEKLKESMLSQFVEPMIWDYNANFDMDKMMLQIHKYQRTGFSHIWFASAFKGATGAAQSLTPISYHLANHLQWLKVAEAVPRDSIQLHGIVLTGWQRYDHFSVLCELLPVGIPSLAVCLQTLKNGIFSEKEEDFVQKCLGFKTLRVNFLSIEDAGNFPGSDIFNRVTQIITSLQESVDKLLEENSYIKGWFSNYHRKRKIVHPIIIRHFEGEVRSVHANWKTAVSELSTALEKIYYPETVEEWLEEHVNPALTRLGQFVQDMDEALASGNLK
ncbi:hexosaminidase D-like isoform X1 [Carcharodon carcharias]|uniref:hexosaminidase D-like isoform X1 n=3 Tax=Carcharodon carcharias TaxID=13397 RepID=UPI001B7F5174|nr:hexosaminidase D-like isoform X1 [Carcharodon carcharias]XP_041072960.1 hexosaminidase D-like isoform X1 [Carcharodon carcharias]XP_041072961.1 hexosaminidase D-like isoform X1 [Carcharodon carcharias]